jgi:hypothetical protein
VAHISSTGMESLHEQIIYLPGPSASDAINSACEAIASG